MIEWNLTVNISDTEENIYKVHIQKGTSEMNLFLDTRVFLIPIEKLKI